MISFDVPGTPRPGGSKVAGFNRKTGKSFVRETGKHTADWRSAVAYVATLTYKGEPLTGPVELRVTFRMPRPAHHFGKGKNEGVLKGTAPTWHTSAPDATKLMRSTEDALKGITWRDDSQVVVQSATKIYSARPGALIEVVELESK